MTGMQRPSTREDLVDQLRVLREAAGLSVRDLAAAVDGRVSTVGGYLSGKHLPTPAQTPLVRRILTALGVTDDADQDRWLEAVARLRRDGGSPGPSPYRGLLSYDMADAPYFHGRAATTEALLARVRAEPGLLAVVGMTGVGKSSLLRAGLMASWTGPVMAVVPGPDPVASWSELAPPPGSLLVVDQLEELFTQVPDGSARSASTARLAELAAAGVHVVVGLRADFFGAALADPVLRSALTQRFFVLGPMEEAELRAAITGPALAAGAEPDADLVDELIDVVLPRRIPGSTQEPGALPLLSHVLLATWEKSRKGRLTLADYRATGGLADAVQRSAEEVWAELPDADHDRARRLLLRLVTVDEDGVVTRRSATVTDKADRDLLEPFIAARLVVARPDELSLAHEALLAAWPRLSDWVQSDRAGLLSRRRLRSAAQLWTEDRTDDTALLRGGRLETIESWLADGDRAADLEPLEQEYLEASRRAEQAAATARRRQVRTLRSWVAVAAVLALLASVLAVVSQVAREDAVTDRERADDAQARALSRQVAGYAVTARESDPALAAQLALLAYRFADTLESRSALLDAAATPTPGVILGRPGSTAMAVSPDGAITAVSNASDGSVRLSGTAAPLRAEPLTVLTQPQGRTDVIYALAWNGAGDRLVAGTNVGDVLVWDVGDPARPVLIGLTEVFGAAGGVQSMGFDDQDRLWVAGPGGNEKEPKSPVGRWRVTATGLEPELTLVPPTTDRVVVQAVAVSGDLVATGESTGRLRLWDVRAGKAGRPIAQWWSPGESWVNVLGFDPAGDRLAVGLRDGSVLEYDVTDPTAPRPGEITYPPFETRVNAVDYSDDGTELVAGGSSSVVRIWRTATGHELAEWGQPATVTALRFHGDGVLVVSDGNLRRYPWPGPIAGVADNSVLVVDWAADSALLLSGTSSGDGRILAHRIDDDGAPHQVWVLPRPTDDAWSSPVALSTDGSLLATGAQSGTIRLWRAQGTTEPERIGPDLVGATGELYTVKLSPTGGLLAAGGKEQALRLWDLADPTRPVQVAVVPDLPGEVYNVSFSPDGTLLTASIVSENHRAETVFDITDPSSPVPVGTLGGFENYVYSSDFAPDGSLVAVTGADGTVRLFDPRDPTLPRVGPILEGPTAQLIWVDFSPDGRTVVAAGNDGLLWVWDVSDPQRPSLVHRLGAGTGLQKTVEYSPDGRWLAAGSSDGTTRLWPTDPAFAAERICAQATAPITERQWRLYLPEQSYDPPCT